MDRVRLITTAETYKLSNGWFHGLAGVGIEKKMYIDAVPDDIQSSYCSMDHVIEVQETHRWVLWLWKGADIHMYIYGWHVIDSDIHTFVHTYTVYGGGDAFKHIQNERG